MLTITTDPDFAGTARVTLAAFDGPSGPGDYRGRSDTFAFDVNVGVGAIYGTKWNDQNNDGVRGTYEPGVEGVTIYLDDDRNGALDPGEVFTVTDASGDYGFTDLDPHQTYTVGEVVPSGWVQTAPLGIEEAFLAADIQPGPASSYPEALTEYNGDLYFWAQTATLGNRLFRFDGTNVSLVGDLFYYLYGTTGRGGESSTLVKVDPITGKTTEIGSVGYTVNGLEWVAATGKLYGTTSTNDPIAPNHLLEINPTTGEGQVIGSGFGVDMVVNLTSDSAGNLFAWTESSDDLVRIDPVAGTATWVGEAGISTATHGLAFDPSDVLYFINRGGEVYTVNPLD
jgi:hypothetical protein